MNPIITVMQGARYAVESGMTKDDVRESVEAALEEYDGFGNPLNCSPMFPEFGRKTVTA